VSRRPDQFDFETKANFSTLQRASKGEVEVMKKLLACALATVALIPATAVAQVLSGLPGGNPGQGGGPSISGPASNSGPGGFGAFDKGNMSDMESDIRNNVRNNQRGEDSSAATRISLGQAASKPLSGEVARSLNQMFPGTRATTKINNGTFAGLKAGMLLWSNGSPIGIVRQIRTADDGSVSVVIVENAKGGFYGVPAEKLAMANGALTTTMRVAGSNTATDTAMSTPPH
jgi:hypothetical protein